MPETIITYFGQQAKVACDGNCKKAFGIPGRPYERVSDEDDDIVYLSDSELPDAPDDLGTYEGGNAKPPSPDYFPNKWCVRACERCAMSKPGESHLELKLKDWSVRVYNMPQS